MFKNKKGMNQIEYIAAMLIFIFGLAVIMYFVLTFNISERQNYLLTIENNFKQEAGINYYNYHLSVNDAGSAPCFSLNKLDDMDSGNLYILSGGNQVGYAINEPIINVDGDNGNYIFRLTEEKGDFGNQPAGTCNPTNAKFSIKEKGFALDYLKIQSLKETNYTPEDYTDFKNELADGKDFTIEFEPLNCEGIETISGMTRYIPHDAQVTAGKFPTKLFVNPREICDVNVLIRVW